jgi:hypothetical protein
MAVNLDEINEKMANMKGRFENGFPKACEALAKDNIVHTLSEALKELPDQTATTHNKPTTKGREI